MSINKSRNEPRNKSNSEPPTLAPRIDSALLYLMDSDGLVFCPERKRIYYLDTIASFIWCGLKDGLALTEISRALTSRFNISSLRAKKDVQELLATWTDEGQTSLPTPVPEVSAAVPTGVAPKQSLQQPVAPRKLAEQCRYRVGVTNVSIGYPSSHAKDIVHPFIAHLSQAAHVREPDAPVAIDIAEHNGRFRLLCAGLSQGSYFADQELVPRLHRLLLTTAFRSSGCLAAIHAGAVSGHGGAVLLPGVSGSGKSTLVAALAHSGLAYQTDELVMLMPDTSLCPLRICLGLKRGSWPLFATRMPALKTLPIHRHPDGTELKYVVPARGAAPPAPAPLRALVFPNFRAGAETTLTPISSARAFYRLAEAGYAIPDELNPELVATLICWVGGQACYELQIGDLDEAASTVRALLE